MATERVFQLTETELDAYTNRVVERAMSGGNISALKETLTVAPADVTLEKPPEA